VTGDSFLYLAPTAKTPKKKHFRACYCRHCVSIATIPNRDSFFFTAIFSRAPRFPPRTVAHQVVKKEELPCTSRHRKTNVSSLLL